MTKRNTTVSKKVLRAIRNYRCHLLTEYLREVKALFKEMNPLFTEGQDEKRSILFRLEDSDDSQDSLSADTDVISLEHSDNSQDNFLVNADVIIQAKKILTEIVNGYHYWQDPDKLFEILDTDCIAYDLFSKYDEQFSKLENLMLAYYDAGEHLSFYLNSMF